MGHEPRIIYCNRCGSYLGEIRDGKLKKGIKFQCEECPVVKPRSKARPDPMQDNSAVDNLMKMFGIK